MKFFNFFKIYVNCFMNKKKGTIDKLRYLSFDLSQNYQNGFFITTIFLGKNILFKIFR